MLKSLWVKFLILLLSVTIISLSAAFILRNLIVKDFNEYLEGENVDRIYKIMAAIEGSYEKYGGWDLEELKDRTIWALMLGYEIKIKDKDNNELVNTATAVDSLSPFMERRILALSGFRVENGSSYDVEFMPYSLFLGGEEIGYIEVRHIQHTQKLHKETVFMERSNRFLLLSLIILGGLSVLLSFIFSKRLTDPIKKLTIAVRNIGEGNTKSRVTVTGEDEISELARTFNSMAEMLEIQQSLRKKLTSNIAHELRTPLTSIQAEIEAMIDGLIPVDKERLLSLHEETRRLKKIIEGIEELSRAEASVLELNKQHVHARPFLDGIRNRFEKLFADKDVRLIFECDDSLVLYASPENLSQIVINLLSNALKATDRDGVVTLRAGKKGSEGFIEVEDTGHGIKKEDLPFIFERFYKASDDGLGLGLTIAKELAEAHGGRIEVRSEYGKGSVFTLYVPEFTMSS